MNTLRFVVRLYLPIGVGVALLCIALFMPFSSANLGVLSLNFSVLGLNIEIPERFRSEASFRIVIGICAAVSMAIGLSTNFAEHFPRHLRMDVFYDIEGIGECLQAFRAEERRALRIDAAWCDRLKAYDSTVIEALREALRAEGADPARVEALDRANMYSRGETSFVVERVSSFRYRICESRGFLEHRVDAQGVPGFEFRTEFALKSSVHDHLQARLGDALRGGHLLRPEFMQVFRLHGFTAARAMDHTVVGATRIRVVPLPHIGRTIYLWADPETGLRVPVSYAVYYGNG